MKPEPVKWNDDEWEKSCAKELDERARATSHLGEWSDQSLFKWCEQYGVVRSASTDYEEASQLLGVGDFFSKVREMAGIKEEPFIRYSDLYEESTKS